MSKRKTTVAAVLLACLLGVSIKLAEFPGQVRPLARIRLERYGEYTWLDSSRLLIISRATDTYQIVSLSGEQRTYPLPQTFDDVSRTDCWGITASPSGEFIAWRGLSEGYSMKRPDLSGSKKVHTVHSRGIVMRDAYWLDDGYHYALMLAQGLGMKIGVVNARTGEHRIVQIKPADKLGEWALDIIGQRGPDKLALCASQNDTFPQSYCRIYVTQIDRPISDQSVLVARTPFGVSFLTSDWLAMTPSGDELVWLVQRPQTTSGVSTILGWLRGTPLGPTFTLCSTNLSGNDLRIIADFPALTKDGGVPAMNHVRVSPDGKKVSLLVNDEILVFAL